MVGRLVEQQQVRGAHQRLREVEPHAPAAGEARHGLRDLLARETQAVQQLLGARAHRVGAGVAQCRVQLADPVAVVGDARLRRARPRAAAASCRRRWRIRLRGAVERRRLLRDVRDAPLLREIDVALVGVQLVAQQREQARLARAVRADQADAVAGVERDVGAFEQRLGAAAEGDLGEADHGEARIVRTGLVPRRWRHARHRAMMKAALRALAG